MFKILSVCILILYYCVFLFRFHLIDTPSFDILKTGSHSKNLNPSPMFTQSKLVVVSDMSSVA